MSGGDNNKSKGGPAQSGPGQERAKGATGAAAPKPAVEDAKVISESAKGDASKDASAKPGAAAKPSAAKPVDTDAKFEYQRTNPTPGAGARDAASEQGSAKPASSNSGGGANGAHPPKIIERRSGGFGSGLMGALVGAAAMLLGTPYIQQFIPADLRPQTEAEQAVAALRAEQARAQTLLGEVTAKVTRLNGGEGTEIERSVAQFREAFDARVNGATARITAAETRLNTLESEFSVLAASFAPGSGNTPLAGADGGEMKTDEVAVKTDDAAPVAADAGSEAAAESGEAAQAAADAGSEAVAEAGEAAQAAEDAGSAAAAEAGDAVQAASDAGSEAAAEAGEAAQAAEEATEEAQSVAADAAAPKQQAMQALAISSPKVDLSGLAKRDEVEAQIAKLDREIAAITERLAALNEAVADNTKRVADTSPVDALAEKLAAQAASLDEMRAAVEKNQGAASAASDAVTSVKTRIEKLENASLNDAAAKDLAFGALAQAVTSARPFKDELAVLEKLIGAQADPALADAAEGGLRSPIALASSFDTASRKALAVANRLDTQNAEGFLDGLGGMLAQMVVVRRVDETEGESASAVLSRAEARIDEGDVASALNEISSLPAEAQDAMRGWIEAASQRASAEAALAALRAKLLSGQ